MPRERIATLKARKKLTPRLSAPVSGIAATHHQNAGSRSACMPRAPSAAAICPVDSVTWRTSSGSAKKAASTGTMPSIRPSEMLATRPEMLARHQRDQRSARGAPSRARMRGFQRIALSSWCSTNQFSVQPPNRLEANNSTPVKAA
ncbi:hypothetical protein X551_04228 [Methylibium sp. T29]|nr:hypothetical protein X551_04228 [Methylibium sp. T29]